MKFEPGKNKKGGEGKQDMGKNQHPSEQKVVAEINKVIDLKCTGGPKENMNMSGN